VTMKANDIRYTVGDVAQTAHMSVRALHHYDELELLRPSRRTEAGYRLYTSDDLERLQQVLFYKELGFSLAEIREIMADPTYCGVPHRTTDEHPPQLARHAHVLVVRQDAVDLGRRRYFLRGLEEEDRAVPIRPVWSPSQMLQGLQASPDENALGDVPVEPGPALRGLLSPRTLEVLPLPQPRNSSVHHGEGVTEPT